MARSVLLTSLPRSGSSWAGWVLGQAEGVSYEREPITQGLLALDVDPFSVRTATNRSFLDLVAKLAERPDRMVIKEVNPLLALPIADSLDAIVILLERHPVAVCRSHIELGWTWGPDTVISDRFPESPERDVLASLEGSSPSFWLWHGAYQAAVAKTVRIMCEGSLVTVRYEDLVANPKQEFPRIAERVNLSWSGGVPQPEGRPTRSPFSLVRRPAVRGWSGGVEDYQIDDCRSGWELIDGAPDFDW